MKNLKFFIVLLLFFASHFEAQKYTATLYFLDGTTKKGKADGVQNNEPKLLFKDDDTQKKEKIKVQLLEKVDYRDPKTDEIMTLELKEFNYYQGSDNPKTEYNWMRKISSGDISMYVTESHDAGVKNNGQNYVVIPSSTITNYFLQYKDEKPAMVYFISSTWTPNKNNIVKRHVKNFFKDKCPKLADDFESEKLEIKDHKVNVLLEYYQKNCNPNQNTTYNK